jgi:hypothetical protein
MKKILILFVLIVFTLTVHSQTEIESRSGYKVYKERITIFTNIGFSRSDDISSINDFLETNDFPKINSFWYDLNYFGIEQQYNRFVGKINFFHSYNSNEQTYNVNENKTNLSINGISGVFGYQIFSNYQWTVTPLVGFEINGAWLELTRMVDDTSDISGLIDSPNILKINNQNFLLKAEIGIRYLPANKLSYGLYIGYKYDLTDSRWEYQNIELENSPEMKLNGFYANISVQFNLFK